MRKRNKGRKFGRKTDQRKAFMNSLVRNLFVHGKIKTTEARAKEMKMLAEKMITKAKKGDLAGIRSLAKRVSPEVVTKLMKEIGPSFKERKGGYTRIIKMGQRRTDGAPMVIIELVK